MRPGSTRRIARTRRALGAACLAALVAPQGATGAPPDLPIELASTARLFAGGVGDGGPAARARIFVPTAVAVHPTTGDVYVADSGNDRIRKIDGDGVITTVAGNGFEGYSADGIRAVHSKLHGPFGVAIDGVGNVYIADTGNHRIRRVDTSGIISTIAGTGEKGDAGDGGRAVDAKLNGPFGVAVDRMGDVYIADTGNHRVRKITVSDGRIRTIAGTRTQGFGGDGGPATRARLFLPAGLAVDQGLNVIVADLGNNRVRRVAAAGTITTLAGNGVPGSGGDGGAPTRASLFYPTGVALDGFGNTFIADFGNNRVRLIDATGRISTIAGSGVRGFAGDGGKAVRAAIAGPFGVAAGDRRLYIADAANNRVRVVDGDLNIATVGGTSADGFSGDGGPATAARIFIPYELALDPRGNLYLADSGLNRIRVVRADGTMSTIAGKGIRGFGGDGRGASRALLGAPRGVAVDDAGNVYVADTFNHRVRRISTGGVITTVAGTGVAGYAGDGGPARRARLSHPTSLSFGPDGTLYVADTANSAIRAITRRGDIVTVAGDGRTGFHGDLGSARAARLSYPSAVSVAPDGRVFIADAGNHRIRVIGADRVIRTYAGTGRAGYSGDGGHAALAELNAPRAVAVAPDGSVYIADTRNHRIRKVTPSGAIYTVGGNGPRGSADEGSAVMLTSLSMPSAIVVDASGVLYISDTGGNRVLRVEPPIVP